MSSYLDQLKADDPPAPRVLLLRHVHGEYLVWNEGETTLLGTHLTRTQAEEQIAQLMGRPRHEIIHMFNAPPPERYECQ